MTDIKSIHTLTFVHLKTRKNFKLGIKFSDVISKCSRWAVI